MLLRPKKYHRGEKLPLMFRDPQQTLMKMRGHHALQIFVVLNPVGVLSTLVNETEVGRHPADSVCASATTTVHRAR